MDDCVFCKIVKGELPCKKVWEDENFLAFLNINPAAEGHTLVIPKKHFNNLHDLEDKFSLNYLKFIKKVAKILSLKYDFDDFNLLLNNGKFAGQVIGHIHFHLLPRKEGDDKKGLFIG